MKPFVSVIIPCFNMAQRLPQTVESVLSQTFTDLECIIVDDGSADNTPQVCDALMKADSRVTYLYKRNGGVASARNFGIKHARGEWIQHLDADDFLHRDKIRFQLEYALDLESVKDTVFYSDYEVVFEKRPHKDPKKTITVTVGDLTKEELLAQVVGWSFRGEKSPLHTNSLLLHKSVFDNNKFNENLSAFSEMELFVDLLLRNVRFVYTPIISMSYRVHGAQITQNRALVRYDYIDYLRTLHEKDKGLLTLCPTIAGLVREAILAGDKRRVDRIMELVRVTPVPAYFSVRSSKITIRSLLKTAHLLGLLGAMARTMDVVRRVKMFGRRSARVLLRRASSRDSANAT